MTELEYILADPTGNITVLVTTPTEEALQPSVAARLMKTEPMAEQVGFLDVENRTLRMAGGEFCGNASMSAATVCAEARGITSGRVELSVSGAEEKIGVTLSRQGIRWQAKADMPLPLSVGERDTPVGKMGFVRFAGISHLISERPLERAAAEKLVRSLCPVLSPAGLGLMQLDTNRDRMTPLVYIPAADTLFWESSCGSGTAAAAAYTAVKWGSCTLRLNQPAGMLSAEAEVSRGKVTALRLGGSVKLLYRQKVNI